MCQGLAQTRRTGRRDLLVHRWSVADAYDDRLKDLRLSRAMRCTLPRAIWTSTRACAAPRRGGSPDCCTTLVKGLSDRNAGRHQEDAGSRVSTLRCRRHQTRCRDLPARDANPAQTVLSSSARPDQDPEGARPICCRQARRRRGHLQPPALVGGERQLGRVQGASTPLEGRRLPHADRWQLFKQHADSTTSVTRTAPSLLIALVNAAGRSPIATRRSVATLQAARRQHLRAGHAPRRNC